MPEQDDAAKKAAAEKAAKDAKAAAEATAKEDADKAEQARFADEQAMRDRIAQLEAELAARDAAPQTPANPNGTITLNAKNEPAKD